MSTRPCHLGGLLFEIEDDAHALLPGVDIGVQQFDEALLGLEGGQHFAEPVSDRSGCR